MAVVNVKVAFIRPEYKNLKEWTNDENNIYIGRAGVVFIKNDDGKKERFPKVKSMFCNPFKVGKDGTREEVIKKYKKYLIEKLKNNSNFRKEFIKLKDKNLGCWCHPEKCHGDVILKILKKVKKTNSK